MVEWMRSRHAPVQGSEIAAHFRVSRQCVVQDVAILRAAGTEILATPQGYRLPENGVAMQCARFSLAGTRPSAPKKSFRFWSTTASRFWT